MNSIRKNIVFILAGYLLLLFTFPFAGSLFNDSSENLSDSEYTVEEYQPSTEFFADIREIEESENESECLKVLSRLFIPLLKTLELKDRYALMLLSDHYHSDNISDYSNRRLARLSVFII